MSEEEFNELVLETKLNKRSRQIAYQLLVNGEGGRELAAKYNVTYQRVYAIGGVLRRLWKQDPEVYYTARIGAAIADAPAKFQDKVKQRLRPLGLFRNGA